MNPQEQELADRIYAAMMNQSINSDRGKQAQEFRVGVSDLGYCSERTRRMLDRQVPEDTDVLKAFIGTAIGREVEEAVVKSIPGAIVQAEVEIVLHGEQRTYRVPGHPDVILDGNKVLDVKTSHGLTLAERHGPDQQKQFQRHCYGVAAFNAGLLDVESIEDVLVGNVWVDRTGTEKRLHVNLEPVNLAIVEEAGRWLDAVVYAFVNGETAQQEPAREVCATTCGFFKVCRQWDTDVTGLITDPFALTAIDLYLEGAELESRGKKYKAEAKPALEGIAGSTGTHALRWVHVNASGSRGAYEKIDLREIKR